MTAPMTLSRQSAGGHTITLPHNHPQLVVEAHRYHVSWEHGPEASSQVYVGGLVGTAGSMFAVDDLGLVSGYLKLAAQAQSDEEKVIDADRRARRDRDRPFGRYDEC